MVICLCVCLCTMCVLQDYGGQKRVLDPPEIKWQMAGSHRVGTGTPNSRSLEEWPELVNTESSFQPSSLFFSFYFKCLLQKFSRSQQRIKQSALLLLELQHTPSGLSEILVSHLYPYMS